MEMSDNLASNSLMIAREKKKRKKEKKIHVPEWMLAFSSAAKIKPGALLGLA